MKKKYTLPVFMILLLFQGFCIKAQEQVVPLSANLQLMSAPAKNMQTRRTANLPLTDTIPFFEDFSYSPNSPYPSVYHWLDSNVFINHTFPIAPPSIGVATFDGLNKKGYPYNINAGSNSSGPADVLTSRPINLKNHHYTYQPSDSIYFSFYYQARGRSENYPVAKDSLILEFYKPNQKKWERVWTRKGYNPTAKDSLFHLVMLPVKDIDYFDSLFQFRFRNKATLSGSNDFWHIDYIYINKGRTYADTIWDDCAFSYMSSPFLKNYFSMPYRQYNATEMAPKLFNYIRNNAERGLNSGPNLSYKYQVFRNNAIQYDHPFTAGNVYPYSQIGTDTIRSHSRDSLRPNYTFPALTDTAEFTIRHFFKTGNTADLEARNDTIIQKQVFSTYYAYDDGTAENGYYLYAYGAKKALRYTINVADTLRALRIYFDPIVDGPAVLASSFRMMVWADGNNKPGNVIYRDSAMYPKYLQGDYNLMPTYKLTSCLLLSPGTYYFGIQQTGNKGLNVGLDMSSDHSNALYYDIGNGWRQSEIKGSVMINPMLGCYYPQTPVGIHEYEGSAASTISVYPNPAQNSIRIATNGVVVENGNLSILSSIGQTVYSSSFRSSDEIDISSLPNGIYFVHLSCEELNTTPQKLIITR